MSTITVTTFKWVPPIVQGLVRDLRVRWALEEAGLAYTTHLIGPPDQQSAKFLCLQPFGQVPVYQEDRLVLFESGAIVLHAIDHVGSPILARKQDGWVRRMGRELPGIGQQIFENRPKQTTVSPPNRRTSD